MFVTATQLQQSPNGVSCRFVKMGSAGMKVYTDRYRRDQCYSLQRFFRSGGLAPFCHFPFDFIGPSGQTLYAFWTDLAECAVKGESTDDELTEWGSRASDVAAELEEWCGCEWSDDHCWNVGCVAGRDVCIDCDPDYFCGLPDEFFEEWQYDSEEECITY